jgi:hypothetical protein
MLDSRSTGRLTGAVVLLAMALAGCGGGDDAAPRPNTRTAAAAKPAPQDRRLTTPGSPGAVVQSTMQLIELGALPAAIAQYQPATVRSVDIEDFASAVQSLQADFETGQPRVRAVKSTSTGTIVVVALHRRGQPASRCSFTLRKRGGKWLIAYDSLMDDAIRSSATARAQSRLTPNRAGTSPPAAAAGIRASSAFRAAGVRGG